MQRKYDALADKTSASAKWHRPNLRTDMFNFPVRFSPSSAQLQDARKSAALNYPIAVQFDLNT